MKTLLVYYSRTGTTRTVAEKIFEKLGGDTVVEEIIDKIDRRGAVGYLKAGRDASLKRLVEIETLKNNPADFDLVIIGTPIWAWTMSAGVRTYATQVSGKVKKAAFFCTMGGDGDKPAFEHLKEILNLEPVATLTLLTREVGKGDFQASINEFVAKLI